VARPLQAQRCVLEDHRRRPALADLIADQPGARAAAQGERRAGCRGPVAALPEFLDFFGREVGISPVWLCPLRQRDRDRRWSLYEFDPDITYVNVGFWSRVELAAHEDPAAGRINRAIERTVSELNGRKSLYSTSFYDRDEFYAIYGGQTYSSLKKQYDPDDRFPDLYDKTCKEA
jgi:FAD/FMN-containing dehydrogenase